MFIRTIFIYLLKIFNIYKTFLWLKTIIWDLKKKLYISIFIKYFLYNLQVAWWSDPASTASWSWWYGEPVSGLQPDSGFRFAPQLLPYISLCCTRSCSSGSSGSDECCRVGSTARSWPSSLSHSVSTWTGSNMVIKHIFFH